MRHARKGDGQDMAMMQAMAKMLELSDRDFKRTVVHMLMDLVG